MRIIMKTLTAVGLGLSRCCIIVSCPLCPPHNKSEPLTRQVLPEEGQRLLDVLLLQQLIACNTPRRSSLLPVRPQAVSRLRKFTNHKSSKGAPRGAEGPLAGSRGPLPHLSSSAETLGGKRANCRLKNST